jgi:hypothetical protein
MKFTITFLYKQFTKKIVGKDYVNCRRQNRMILIIINEKQIVQCNYQKMVINQFYKLF